MKKSSIITTTISLALVTVLSAGVVFAANNTGTKKQNFLDEKFAGYVSSGIITQEQSDKILEDLKSSAPQMKDGKGFGRGFGPMFMTDEEKAKFEAMTDDEKQAYIKEQKAKFEAMTDEEKQAFMEKMKENMPQRSPMIKLTDEQRTALVALSTTEEKIAYVEGIMTDDQKAKFEALTDEQKEACVNRLSENRPVNSPMIKLTDEQRTALAALSTTEEKIAYVEGIMTDDQKAKFEALTDEQKEACVNRLSVNRPQGKKFEGKGMQGMMKGNFKGNSSKTGSIQ